MGLLAKLTPWRARAAEGATTPGPWLLPEGWLSTTAGKYMNWWQMGFTPSGGSSGSATVRACISCYAQTVAMCPGTHWRATDDGGRERVKNSALSRVLKRPNSYLSISDFLLNLTANLYEEGNAYALAVRNSRFEIAELHLMSPRSSFARVGPEGEIFYQLGGNEIAVIMFGAEALSAVPARDVLHLRLNTKRNPLRGEPPLTAEMVELSASNVLIAQALAATQHDGRPPGVIETDLLLSTEQVEGVRKRLRDVFGTGETPLLTGGLKWKSTLPSSRDAQLAELLQISDQRVASIFRVPVPMLSLTNSQMPQASTESLMRFWLAGALGFTLNHIEEGIGRLFGLAGQPDEYLELDTSILLRSNFKEMVEGLGVGVEKGLYAPNEGRAVLELPRKPYGDEPRVQQQVVPLSAWGQMQPQTPRPDAPPSPPPAAPTDPAATAALTDAWTKQILDAADRHRPAA